MRWLADGKPAQSAGVNNWPAVATQPRKSNSRPPDRKSDVLPLRYNAILSWVRERHETGSQFVTQRPSNPGIQRPGDRVDPVTLFYNELQMSTYVADKRLQWARGLPLFIAVWRLYASGKYNFEDHLLNVNISTTVGRIFTKIYISLYLYLGLFRTAEKLGSHTGSK